MNNLLIYKYKPQTIDDLLLSNNNKYLLNKYLENSYFNLILEGESGCGKSSLINIVIKHYYNNNVSVINNHVCYISLLRDQGINFYKNEVKIFINNCINNSYKKIIVIEDVDRFRNDAASVLLKSLEEPPPGTVWLLCAPTSDDVFETIRSRCRQVVLTSPTLESIAQQLTNRYGIEKDLALFSARAAQGHIGRAKAIATDELVRQRRNEILDMPNRVHSVVSCFEMAATIVANANADTDSIVEPLDIQDEKNIRTAYGDGVEGFKGVERQIKSAVKALEKRAKDRRRRVLSDQYDRVLLDLTGFYRDVLIIQSGSDLVLINEELRPKIEKLAQTSSSAETLKRIDVIRETRDNLLANVNPVSAFESMLVTFRNPQLLSSGS